MLGTRPSGFIARYSGVEVRPNWPPASIRSYFRPNSSKSQITFITLLELVRPHSLIMRAPPVFGDQLAPRRSARSNAAMMIPRLRFALAASAVVAAAALGIALASEAYEGLVPCA